MNQPRTSTSLTLSESATGSQPLIRELATKYGVDEKLFYRTMQSTIIRGSNKRDATIEEMIAFLTVAKQYNLNPWVGEIFAFPKKGGGIQAVVGVDGWATIINSQKQMDGLEFEDHFNADATKIVSITCRIHRKDRSKPIECTEYLSECFISGKEPWERWPNRMLRHKALIQCARIAFGLAGLVDPDEAERMKIAGALDEPRSQTKQVHVTDQMTSSLQNPSVVVDAEFTQSVDQQNDAGEESQVDAAEETPAEKTEQTRYQQLMSEVEECETEDDVQLVTDHIGMSFEENHIDMNQGKLLRAALKARYDRILEGDD